MVSGVEGVEVQTEVAWRMAAELGLPRMFFVNKLDRERASFDRTMDQLRDRFGAGVAPLELPIGEEASFRGIADLLTDKAHFYDGPKATIGEIPEDMEAREHEVHDNLVEGIVVADDDLIERYLEGEDISPKELEEALAKGVAEASVFPVMCGSAAKLIGIDRLAQLICEVGPSPLDRPPVTVQAGDGTMDVGPDPAGQPLAVVYKTLADPYVGKISFFRVLSGTIRPDALLTNSRTTPTSASTACSPCGARSRSRSPTSRPATWGRWPSCPTPPRATRWPPGTPVVVPPPEPPTPVLSIAIRPKSKADEDKLTTALHRLQDEDPSLRSGATTRPTRPCCRAWARPTFDRHRAAAPEVRRRGGDRGRPGPLPGDDHRPGRGRGQVQEADRRPRPVRGGVLRVEPLERGGGFEFVDAIVGGAIPRQFIPAVEKGVRETMTTGGIYGYPVVDVRVTLLRRQVPRGRLVGDELQDGGLARLPRGDGQGRPTLLEPISLLEVSVPIQFQGDVMGDLNSRRGRVQGTEAVGNGEQMITAMVPTSEMLRYSIDLRSMTGGRGCSTSPTTTTTPCPATSSTRWSARTN